MSPRKASLVRRTTETSVEVELNLDGSGEVSVETTIGFFNHMLTTLGKHALFNLRINAQGDTHVDAHHLVEDVGIVLGKCINEALGDRHGINRFGFAIVPMDDALVLTAVDLSGRSYFACDVALPTVKLGQFDAELTGEFFRALAFNGQFNLHIKQLSGANAHHIIEATCKATAIALRHAIAPCERIHDALSTKGTLE